MPTFTIWSWDLPIFWPNIYRSRFSRLFSTSSRLIWKSFFHTKNHRMKSPTGHRRPLFAVVKLKISPVESPLGLSPLLGTLVTDCGVHPPDFTTLQSEILKLALPYIFNIWYHCWRGNLNLWHSWSLTFVVSTVVLRLLLSLVDRGNVWTGIVHTITCRKYLTLLGAV